METTTNYFIPSQSQNNTGKGLLVAVGIVLIFLLSIPSQAHIIIYHPGSGKQFTLSGLHVNECIPQSVAFAIADTINYDSVHWDFGDTASHELNYANTFATRHVYPGSGIYFYKMILYQKGGIIDTIRSRLTIPPLVYLGSDQSICPGETLNLSIPPTGGSLLWNNGSTDATVEITQPGIYWVSATVGSCKAADTIQVYFLPAPVVNLGPDTTLCEHSSLELTAGNPGATYKWQNGSTQQTYQVTSEGLYHVTVEYAGCKVSDTIQVHYTRSPAFQWNTDSSFCQGSTLLLRPGVPNTDYRWQDGSTDSVYQVHGPGQYTVTASNLCGSFQNTITVKQGYCQIIVPNGFTPNSDGTNDVFRALGTEQVSDYKLTIYNRWGQKVFYSEDKHHGWDGNLDGKQLPPGTYVYLIHYRNYGSTTMQVIKGSINLIR